MSFLITESNSHFLREISYTRIMRSTLRSILIWHSTNASPRRHDRQPCKSVSKAKGQIISVFTWRLYRRDLSVSLILYQPHALLSGPTLLGAGSYTSQGQGCPLSRLPIRWSVCLISGNFWLFVGNTFFGSTNTTFCTVFMRSGSMVLSGITSLHGQCLITAFKTQRSKPHISMTNNGPTDTNTLNGEENSQTSNKL